MFIHISNPNSESDSDYSSDSTIFSDIDSYEFTYRPLEYKLGSCIYNKNNYTSPLLVKYNGKWVQMYNELGEPLYIHPINTHFIDTLEQNYDDRRLNELKEILEFESDNPKQFKKCFKILFTYDKGDSKLDKFLEQFYLNEMFFDQIVYELHTSYKKKISRMLVDYRSKFKYNTSIGTHLDFFDNYMIFLKVIEHNTKDVLFEPRIFLNEIPEYILNKSQIMMSRI